MSYGLLSPKMFQGEVLIKSASVLGKSVEPVAALIDKLKQPTYYSQNSITQCAQNESQPGSYLAGQLKATTLKDSGLVSITYRAKSPELAKACLEAVLLDIQANQERLAQSMVKTKDTQLKLTALISMLILTKKDLATQRENLEAQEIDLTTITAEPASAAAPVFASDIPISPKTNIAMFGGLTAGLSLGVLWLIARKTWQKIKPQLQ